jgi:phage FluMu protein Com
MTTVERLKIRCYRCNQLLAVAPNKAGTVVACPKCKADLLVPRSESPTRDEGAEDGGSSGNLSDSVRLAASGTVLPRISAESPSFLDEIAAIIPPEVASLRPEDLRVEAEFFNQLSHEPAPPVRSEPEPSLTARSDPFQFPESFSPEDFPPPQPEKPLRYPPAGGFAVETDLVAATSALIQTPPPLPAPAPEPIVPPIQFEPPPVTLLPPSQEPRRISEVTLPASVVVAWSLFVLVAVAMSFIAGLMMGHFLWRNSP